MSPAKQGFYQHALLHESWPPPHCCLCNAESELREARERIAAMQEKEARLDAAVAQQIGRIAALEAGVKLSRSALCHLMNIDGSPESLNMMRVVIVSQAGTAPNAGTPAAAMQCVDAVAATADLVPEEPQEKMLEFKNVGDAIRWLKEPDWESGESQP